MISRLLAVSAVLSLTVVLLTACVSAPVQEMSDARQAVEAAQRANAERLAPRLMDAAEQHLERAERELQNRNYDAARDAAVAARESAIQARTTATEVGDK